MGSRSLTHRRAGKMALLKMTLRCDAAAVAAFCSLSPLCLPPPSARSVPRDSVCVYTHTHTHTASAGAFLSHLLPTQTRATSSPTLSKSYNTRALIRLSLRGKIGCACHKEAYYPACEAGAWAYGVCACTNDVVAASA